MGNNEFLEPAYFAQDGAALAAAAMPVPAERTNALNRLAANIERMVALCEAHRVGLLIMPAAANLLYFPRSPQHSAAHAIRTGSWMTAYAAVRPRMMAALHMPRVARTNWEDLREDLRELIALDPAHAVGHYWLGIVELGLGNMSNGLATLAQAARLDRHASRATPDVRETMVTTCRRLEAPVCDVGPLFYDELAAQMQLYRKLCPYYLYDGSFPFEPCRVMLCAHADRVLFLDNCHPLQRGHDVILSAITNAVVELGLLP